MTDPIDRARVLVAVALAARPVDPHPDWTLSDGRGSFTAHDSTVPGAVVEGDRRGSAR